MVQKTGNSLLEVCPDTVLPLPRSRQRRRGGRPEKEAAAQRNRVVKTNLTGGEYERLLADFRRITAGRRISFAQFLRDRLLAADGVGEERSDDACRLDALLLLQDCREQLRQVLARTHRPVSVSGNAPERTENEATRLEPVVRRVEETLNQLTEWWFA